MIERAPVQYFTLAVIFIGLSIILTSCSLGKREGNGNFIEPNVTSVTDTDSLKPVNPVVEIADLLIKEGKTLETRIQVPSGYQRVPVIEGSFQGYLRMMKLKPHGSKVHYYNGRIKDKQDVYVAVADISIGERDLHQCADAIMLLRAQYLFDLKKYPDIHFNFTNGFKAEYVKWRTGHRIAVEGNAVTWVNNGLVGDTAKNFRKYMDMVFAYAGTLSLEKELNPIAQAKMQIGDVFIVGGSPGHAVIVVDMAVNSDNGHKLYLLAQSYTPAQDTQILANSKENLLNPWYSLQGEEGVQTPEWTFSANTLRRFAGE